MTEMGRKMSFNYVELYVKASLGGKAFQNSYRAVALIFRADDETLKQDDIPDQCSGLGALSPIYTIILKSLGGKVIHS